MIFNLHGLGFEVNSKNNKFLEYLRFRFQAFASKIEKVDVKFYVEFGKPSLNLSSYERMSHNFYSSQNKFIIKKENVTIFYDLNKNPLNVIIYFHPKNPKHLARFLLKGKKNTIRDYYEHFIIWRGIQNTLLALLEQRGFSVLHASAVKGNEGATLFFGLGGVGKTTIALDLILSKNLKLMGDNFILINEENAYPFLEPITLTKFKKKILTLKRWKQIIKKNETFNSYFPKKNYSHNSFCDIKNIIFLNVSQNNNLIRINKSKSLNLIKNIMKILGETPEFTELNMIFPKKIMKINDKIKFYELSYKNLEGAKKLITNIL